MNQSAFCPVINRVQGSVRVQEFLYSNTFLDSVFFGSDQGLFRGTYCSRALEQRGFEEIWSISFEVFGNDRNSHSETCRR